MGQNGGFQHRNDGRGRCRSGHDLPEGEVLAPQAAAIQPVAPGLPAAGVALDEFRRGDPLFETAQEALEYKEAARSLTTTMVGSGRIEDCG